MRVLFRANDARLAVVAWWHTRRAFRRYRVSLAEQKRLKQTARRRTR